MNHGTIERQMHIDASPEVVFELALVGSGTLLRMTETGFRARGWEEAKVAAEHAEHVTGWDHFLSRLPAYAASVHAQA